MITVERLNEVIASLFLTSELVKIGWNELTDTDKQILINKADNEINRLQFIGVVKEENQKNAFPRVYDTQEYGVDCVENAMAQFIYSYLFVRTDETIQKIKQGITSIKIADASESYASSSQVDINSIENSYKKYLVDYIYRGCY